MDTIPISWRLLSSLVEANLDTIKTLNPRRKDYEFQRLKMGQGPILGLVKATKQALDVLVNEGIEKDETRQYIIQKYCLLDADDADDVDDAPEN